MAKPELKAVDQLAMDEREIDDDELQRVLDERAALYDQLDPVRKRYNELHAKAKALVLERVPEGTAARCGVYRLEVTRQAGRRVSFETASRASVRIVGPADVR